MIIYPTRDLDLLDPELKALCMKWKTQCEAEGLSVLVTQTHRSAEYQNSLYAQGRTKPGPIVTNAKAGNSAHEFNKDGKPWARAFDFVPLNAAGKADWNDAKKFAQAGAIATKLGLEWGGSWTGFKDMPHIQLFNWRTRP
jgi:peptidoglycan LD-endopeptidase CwlK